MNTLLALGSELICHCYLGDNSQDSYWKQGAGNKKEKNTLGNFAAKGCQLKFHALKSGLILVR
jgi:hypothetical protein